MSPRNHHETPSGERRNPNEAFRLDALQRHMADAALESRAVADAPTLEIPVRDETATEPQRIAVRPREYTPEEDVRLRVSRGRADPNSYISLVTRVNDREGK